MTPENDLELAEHVYNLQAVTRKLNALLRDRKFSQVCTALSDAEHHSRMAGYRLNDLLLVKK